MSAPNSEHTPGAPTQEDELVTLARQVAEQTWDTKALNTVVIDLRGRVSYTDFVVISTGTSERHVKAIARNVETAMRQAGHVPLGIEGTDTGRWVLLDFGEVIVHLFHGDLRQEYNLEKMWVEAPRLELEDKPRDLYGQFDMQQFGA